MNEKIKQMIGSLRSKMAKVLTHMTARNTGRAKISSLIIIGICLTLILTMTVGAAAVMRSTSPTPDTVIDVTEEVTESTMTTEESEATTAETEETVPEETEATEAAEVTEVTEETKPTEESNEKTQEPTDGNSSDSGVYNTWDTCVGTFSIPSVGLSVNCYASASQATVDAKNSAAYFYSQGHSIIGDHVNQGFNKIKSCREGTTAYLAGVEYECVDVMSGHNDGSRLTTSGGSDIRDVYPGALVAYTCNGNWQNVTLVFFKVAGTDLDDMEDEMGSSSDIYPSEDGRAPCVMGAHDWYLEDSFEYLSYENGRERFLHEHFICSRCNSDWIRDTLLESDPDFSWEVDDEEEEEEEEETLPSEPEPPIVDEPIVDETEPKTEPEESGNGSEEILPPVQNEPTVEPTPEPEPEPEGPAVEEPVVEDAPSEIVESEEPEYSDGFDIDISNM